ncbi:MAG TPA: epoxide hydrolase [Alphaproteobacteria bacterium]|jgi:microsomal epoxide hydrolase|nr:epoxide hydrolase [Alphaproteobacteria bacterium]
MDDKGLSRRDVMAAGAGIVAVSSLGLTASAAVKGEPAMKDVTPFKIDVPQARLDYIHRRLKDAEWPDVPEAEDAWRYGTSNAALKDLVDYAVNKYDWRAREAAMNKHQHFHAHVDGYDIHFMYEKGSGSNPQPLIMTHGWPGSYVEFLKAIDMIAHPEKFGGNAEDAFTVICPSIPGFGFSSKPKKPISSRDVAVLWDKMMTQNLGYASYCTQGGDYGSTISVWLGAEGKGCKAVHLNFLLGVGGPVVTDEDKAAMARWGEVYMKEGGYIHIQSTKPQSLSAAMTDSPLGVTAWIFEKMKTWSDNKGDPWTAFTRDEVLDNIFVYLVTNTFGTASWMYTGGATPAPPVPPGKITKPTAIAHFPGELVFWPKSYAERQFNLIHWTDMPHGGHFAAMEQPELFSKDVLTFGKLVKNV